MLPAEIIRKKRDGSVLTAEEITGFIEGYVSGEIPDYQASALLMAIFFKGMTPQETATLTRTMMHSGRTYDLTSDRPLIDKHSTGGVGDKVSLILAPLAAACGLGVPMVCGRGLGHTGGTLDKLESIPGFNIHLSPDQFKKQLQELGVAMLGQSDDFVPADKKMYALRDVTGTVECIPLLCSSILSKKAASGARGVVMDVKCGSGAFMQDMDGARALANGLLTTGNALGLPVRAVITDMSQPLGAAVGNANEVIESIDCLRGAGPADLRKITLELAAEMLVLGKLETDISAAHLVATAALDDGSAMDIFRLMVEGQGGDPRIVDDTRRLPSDYETVEFVAQDNGYLTVRNCRDIGLAALALGAGRRKATDDIDPAVGLTLQARAGDRVSKGQPLVKIHHRTGKGLEECRNFLKSALAICPDLSPHPPLIMERI